MSDYSETTKILLYGKWGTCKTLQIGNLIESVGADHVTVLSAEKGLGTIESKIRADRTIEVDTKDELRAAWARVKAIPRGDWLCVDGATNIFNWTLTEHASAADRFYDCTALGKEPNRDDKPAGRFMSDKSLAIDMQKVYGRVGRDLTMFIQEAVKLECHQFWTFLEDLTGTSNREKALPYGPDVPGKVALTAMMSKFDYIGRLQFDNTGRLVCGFDSKSSVYLARTRNDRAAGIQVPAEIPDFNLATFIASLKPTTQETP